MPREEGKLPNDFKPEGRIIAPLPLSGNDNAVGISFTLEIRPGRAALNTFSDPTEKSSVTTRNGLAGVVFAVLMTPVAHRSGIFLDQRG